MSVELDGKLQSDEAVPLVDDGQTHNVRVVLGEKAVSEPDAADTKDEATHKGTK
jgi:hypothetical protein